MNTFLAVICVLAFSLTVPFTRIASSALEPEAVAAMRLLGAAIVCLIAVVGFDRWVPPREIWAKILAPSIGSVVAFSLLIALAMKRVPATHGAIAFAALPAATAVYASLRDRINPGVRFWVFSLIGTLATLVFLAMGSESGFEAGDWLLIGSVLSSAFGYVEGARLSRDYGGRRVMSWAILFALPIVIPASAWVLLKQDLPSPAENPAVWGSVAYLALISQSLGMFVWYKVLAQGSMARTAMIQLLQPFFTLAAAVLMLGEQARPEAWLVTLLVAASVFGANRERQKVLVKGPAVARGAFLLHLFSRGGKTDEETQRAAL